MVRRGCRGVLVGWRLGFVVIPIVLQSGGFAELGIFRELCG